MSASFRGSTEATSSRITLDDLPFPAERPLASASTSPLKKKGKGKAGMVRFAGDLGMDVEMTFGEAADAEEGSAVVGQTDSREPNGLQTYTTGEGENGNKEDGDQSVSDAEREGSVTDGEDDDNYEQKRQARIRENQRLLTSLGIDPGLPISSSSSSLILQTTTSSPRRGPGRAKFSTNAKRQVLDRSGYIISLPRESERHKIACVEIPPDRRLRRMITEGEYEDRSWWAEGEARRRRFGRGRGGMLVEGEEEEEVGGVGIGFRWRRWKGLEKELRAEMKKRGELVERDVNPQIEVVPTDGEVSAYSLIPGDTCHQCRRKSEKLKMRCRNVNPICRASFCESCCKRYSYFDFDPESRSFLCPLCKDCCNCSNCIRKRNLTHILDATMKKTAIRRQSLKHLISSEDADNGVTVQTWLEKAVANQPTPFDRVRLVDQAEDVITPELPPEVVEEVKDDSKKGKRRGRPPLKGGLSKKTEPSKEISIGKVPRITIKFKIPDKHHADQSRTKEVDSDGDTVGGFSSEGETGIGHIYGRSRGSSRSRTSSSPSPDPGYPKIGTKDFPTLAAASAELDISSAQMSSWVPPSEFLYYGPDNVPVISNKEDQSMGLDVQTVYQAYSNTANGELDGFSPSVLGGSGTGAVQSSTPSSNAHELPPLHPPITFDYNMSVTPADTLIDPWVSPQVFSGIPAPRLNHESHLPVPSSTSFEYYRHRQEYQETDFSTFPIQQYALPLANDNVNYQDTMPISSPPTILTRPFQPSPLQETGRLQPIPRDTASLRHSPLYTNTPLQSTNDAISYNTNISVNTNQNGYLHSPDRIAGMPHNPAWAQNLDLLSLAAAEAKHSPSVMGYEDEGSGYQQTSFTAPYSGQYGR